MSVKIEVTGDTAADVREEFARLFGWNRPELPSQAQQEADDRAFEAEEAEREPVRTQEYPDDVPTGTTRDASREGDDATEQLYGGTGKVRSTNAQRLKNEIIARIENGQEVADDQIGRLPAKEKEAVREAQRNAAPAETASEPEPEQPAEPEATPEPAAEEPAGEQTQETQYSLDDVQTEIIRIHKDLGDPGLTKAREVFAKHGNGATKRSQIPAECVDAVVTALKEIGGS